ncbi:MAG: SEL1-like repeat protein [Verrucomicrobiota bacterium]
MAAPTKQAPAPAATPDVPAPTTPIPPPTSIDQLKLKDRAQEGDSAAAQVLGMSYYFGIGVPQDYLQAFAWCLKAARQGNVDAQFNIAYMYLYGQGTDASPSSAVQWYLKAANTGRPNAEYSLAECYATGTGVAQDAAQAVAWYAKAAAQENTDAMVRIGDVYAHGLGTIPENKRRPSRGISRRRTWARPRPNTWPAMATSMALERPRTPTRASPGCTRRPSRATPMRRSLSAEPISTAPASTPIRKKRSPTSSRANGDGDACAQVALCYQKGLFVARDPIMAYAWALRAVSKSRKPELAKYADELKSFFGLSPAQIQAATAKEAEIGRMLSTDYLSADVGFSFTPGQSHGHPLQKRL